MNIGIWVTIGIVVLGITVFLVVKFNKIKTVIVYLVNLLNEYGKNVINKVKLAILINTLRSYTLSKINNLAIKFLVEWFWPEINLVDTAFKIGITNNKNEVINSIPDVIVSKTVDSILNNTKYTDNTFSTSTNLKITEKDRGYLEAYLEGQINKLEESRVGIKAGIKW